MTGKRPLKIHELIEDKVIEKEYGKTPKPFNQFSPSMTGYCKRQMYNRKFNLTKMPRYVKGILHSGTVNHFWLEHHLPELVEDRALKTEVRVRSRIEIPEKDFDIYVYGEADVVDSAGYVYDHKFTGDVSYVEDKPKKKDRRQVMVYINALDGVETGQLEYVTRDGKFQSAEDNVVRHTFDFDEQEFQTIKDNMADVAEKVRIAEMQETEKINPFDKCEKDCYFCSNEEFKDEVKEELPTEEYSNRQGNLNDN